MEATVPARPTVASLIPSGTDLAAALGHADGLVGVSHSCDHPAAAGLPVLTASAVPAAGRAHGAAPGEVDRAVGSALAAGTALYTADTARLADLAPDVVLSQDVCDVCAVPGAEAAAGVPAGAELVMLTATTLAGLERDLAAVGRALGRTDEAARVWREVTARIEAVGAAVAGAPRPRVLALEWTDPPFLAGHWVPELVVAAGGEHVLTEPGAPSRRASWDEIAGADPDVVLSVPCGYDLPTTRDETAARLADSPLGATPAAAAGAVWALDASRLTSRCTPAVARAVEVIAGILHPDRVPAPDAADAARVDAATAAR